MWPLHVGLPCEHSRQIAFATRHYSRSAKLRAQRWLFRIRRADYQCGSGDRGGIALAMHDLWRVYGSLPGLHRTDAEDRGYATVSGDGGIGFPRHDAGGDHVARITRPSVSRNAIVES